MQIQLCEKTEIGNKQNITAFKFQNNFLPWTTISRNSGAMYFDDGRDMFDAWV